MSDSITNSYGLLRSIAMWNIGPTYGKVFVVCPAADANYNRLADMFVPDGEGAIRLFTSLESAYAATTSNQNDVMLLTGNEWHNVVSTLTLAKSRVHLIGMGFGTGAFRGRYTDQASKVQFTANTVATNADLLHVTGTRNIIRGIKFVNSNTDASSLYCANFYGCEGVLVEGCSFLQLDKLGTTTAADVCMGCDSCTFRDCEFGFDTLTQTAARATMLIDSTNGGGRFKDNYFENCHFKSQSKSSSKLHIKVADTNSVLFTNLFDNCTFQCAIMSSTSAIAATNAVASATGLVEGTLYFRNPGVFGCTNFCATITDGVKVFATAASNNAFESVTPA